MPSSTTSHYTPFVDLVINLRLSSFVPPWRDQDWGRIRPALIWPGLISSVMPLGTGAMGIGVDAPISDRRHPSRGQSRRFGHCGSCRRGHRWLGCLCWLGPIWGSRGPYLLLFDQAYAVDALGALRGLGRASISRISLVWPNRMEAGMHLVPIPTWSQSGALLAHPPRDQVGVANECAS